MAVGLININPLYPQQLLDFRLLELFMTETHFLCMVLRLKKIRVSIVFSKLFCQW